MGVFSRRSHFFIIIEKKNSQKPFWNYGNLALGFSNRFRVCGFPACACVPTWACWQAAFKGAVSPLYSLFSDSFLFWRKPHKNIFPRLTTKLKCNTENKQGRLRLRKIEMDYEWQTDKKLAKFFRMQFPWHSSFKRLTSTKRSPSISPTVTAQKGSTVFVSPTTSQ